MPTKIFISQPMRGKSKKEILAERKKIEQAVRLKFDDYEIPDSFFEDYPEAEGSKNPFLAFFGKSLILLSYAPEAEGLKNPSLASLGKSLILLSHADVAVFAEGWEHARGCSIEYMAAKAYEIDILYWNRYALI